MSRDPYIVNLYEKIEELRKRGIETEIDIMTEYWSKDYKVIATQWLQEQPDIGDFYFGDLCDPYSVDRPEGLFIKYIPTAEHRKTHLRESEIEDFVLPTSSNKMSGLANTHTTFEESKETETEDMENPQIIEIDA